MQVTDFHPDWFYRSGAHLNDLCHVDPDILLPDATAAQAETGKPSSEVAKKKKKDHKEARAGYWAPHPGTECDTSVQLVNATFDYIQRELMERQGGIDFVIWTGDNVRHDNDNRYPRTLKQIYSSNDFMVRKMQDIFGADKYADNFIPVVPTVGNNDVYPHNIMFAGPSSKTISNYKAMWKLWVPPEQSHTFDRGAYFHMPVAPKLSVVSLNSLYFYENNKAMDGCSSREEPGTLQLDWLEIQLKLFRQQNIQAWIIGHIPPTDRQWYDGCFDRYSNLMIEFRDLVIGQIFGHVNIDHFYFLKHREKIRTKAERDKNEKSVRRGLLNKPKDELHIQKNPLDVLTDARIIFDDLPLLPVRRQSHKKSSPEAVAAVDHLAVVNVGPSVVPNYYPTLRVYEYLVNVTESGARVDEISAEKKKKKKKKKRPKKPSIPPVDRLGPGYVQQRYTPMKYVQLYLNTTKANSHHTTGQVNYELEYDTSEAPYSMVDLTVASWVALGNQISGLHGRGKLSKSSLAKDPRLLSLDIDSEDDDRDNDTSQDEKDDEAVENLLARRKKNKKRRKHRRHDGFWKVFMHRGFVGTGLEHEYAQEG